MNGPLKHLFQKNSYFSYNSELFGRNKNTSDLEKKIDLSYLFGLHNDQNATIFIPW